LFHFSLMSIFFIVATNGSSYPSSFLVVLFIAATDENFAPPFLSYPYVVFLPPFFPICLFHNNHLSCPSFS
jgi:hypothetical protein